MAWPKGVSRTGKNGTAKRSGADGGAVVSSKTLDEVAKTASTAPRRKINLTSPQFDPFTKFKTDEKRFYYRAVNVKPENLSVREAEGFELIPNSRFGDLVLARLPRETHEERKSENEEKAKRQTEAAVNQFKEEAARVGVEAFEENEEGGTT